VTTIIIPIVSKGISVPLDIILTHIRTMRFRRILCSFFQEIVHLAVQKIQYF